MHDTKPAGRMGAAPTARARLARILAPLAMISPLLGCGEAVYNQLELMPSPEIYKSAEIDPFPDLGPADFFEQTQLFYVTDREPAEPVDGQARYANQRGHLLRAGTAEVRASPHIDDWNKVREVTLTGKRDEDYTLSLTAAQEIGVLPVSVTPFTENAPDQAEIARAGAEFARRIDKKLALSAGKDIFIYIHGYNVDFNYPILVSKELQHYLGYQGAFITYAWPATPSRFAYFKDAETANSTRRNLRELLQFLSDTTQVRRIHLIGYSAGSRLAFEVAYQVALMNRSGGDAAARQGPRLGQVVLLGSDLDRAFFAQTLADGILDAVDGMSIYVSNSDSALNVSKLVFGRERLGQIPQDPVPPGPLQQKMAGLAKLSIIDVSDAKDALFGNGHWYFRASPWASSDILATLLYGLAPLDRGLVRQAGQPVWQFPADYPEQLAQALRADRGD